MQEHIRAQRRKWKSSEVSGLHISQISRIEFRARRIHYPTEIFQRLESVQTIESVNLFWWLHRAMASYHHKPAVLSLCLACVWVSLVSADGTDSLEQVIEAKIRIPHGHEVQRDLFAVGYQIYSFNGSSWVLKNVSADLFDCKGKKVGFHYYLKEKDFNGGQATWATTNPISRVTAKPVAAVPRLDSIADLLLASTNTTGKTHLGSTSFVQRLFTRHGLPPSGKTANVGDVYESDYTALYTFAYPKKSLVKH